MKDFDIQPAFAVWDVATGAWDGFYTSKKSAVSASKKFTREYPERIWYVVEVHSFHTPDKRLYPEETLWQNVLKEQFNVQ
jgi:hypothetical protein